MLESEDAMTFDEWYATQKHQLSNEQVCRVIWEAATREEREACADVCRRRGKAMRETIRAANQRTSEHIMLRRGARLEEAFGCAAEIIGRSNLNYT